MSNSRRENCNKHIKMNGQPSEYHKLGLKLKKEGVLSNKLEIHYPRAKIKR